MVTADGGYRTAQVVPFKTAYTDPALDNYIPVEVALRLIDGLDLAPEQKTAILDAARAALKGEVTVERSDVMRGVGRALATLGLDAAEASAGPHRRGRARWSIRRRASRR